MRVILTDDHDIVRDGLRWMLEGDEIEVVGEAASGEALIDLVDEVPADVVLLDLRMPGMGGLEALEVLRRTHPDVNVIVLTMHRESAYVRRALELGASGYLLKRTSRDQLLEALRNVHGGGAYIHSELVGAVVQQALGNAETSEPVRLEPQERAILDLVAQGLGNREIADELGQSDNYVKDHLRVIFDRLGVTGRAEAVAVAMRTGIIE